MVNRKVARFEGIRQWGTPIILQQPTPGVHVYDISGSCQTGRVGAFQVVALGYDMV